jgi:[acyl-carrier-protein] S-malonyltransferase
VIGGGIASARFRWFDVGLRRPVLTKINQPLQTLDRRDHPAIYAPSFRGTSGFFGFQGHSMTRAFIFPGQGSQAVGMGLALSQGFAAARLVFEEVDEALKQKLSKLMFEGPESDLVLTENAQPALMAVSIAALRVLEAEGGWRLADKASFVAGHSLGEYSALAAAGALGLSDAARLLKLRGQAMQKAVPVGVGAMAALLGPELEQVQKIAKQAADDTKKVCGVANDNSPGQVVVSGAKEAVERAIAIAAEQGVKRSVMLPVSAPFHCALMQPAADAMEEALAKATIRQPLVPVVANVTAQPVSDAATIAKLLVQQVTATVRWRESMLAMKALGVTKMYELGAGKVLAGLVKRIDKEIEASSVGAPADVEAALKGLS